MFLQILKLSYHTLLIFLIYAKDNSKYFFKTHEINTLNSFFTVINVFEHFLFYKTKNPPFLAGFSIFFKEKSTRPIINNSAGGANNT